MGCLDLVEYVYGLLGFEVDFELSTRPEDSLGK